MRNLIPVQNSIGSATTSTVSSYSSDGCRICLLQPRAADVAALGATRSFTFLTSVVILIILFPFICFLLYRILGVIRDVYYGMVSQPYCNRICQLVDSKRY